MTARWYSGQRRRPDVVVAQQSRVVGHAPEIGDLLAVRPSVIAIMTVSRDTLSVRKEGVDTRDIVDLIRI